MADPEPVPITRTREFWTLVGYAAVFGSVMGLVAYIFLAIVGWATDVLWTDTDSYGWFAGEPWWILLMGGVGLTIGIIRRVLRVQPVIPGLFDEIDERRVEPATVPRRVLVGFVSLIGGASVGPEAPLASIGGGLATWVSERRQEPESVAETNTLVAMAGAFGGLFSAPMISALLVVEAATPEGGRRRYAVTAIPVLIAAVAGFAVYFALAQTTFVDVYQVPPYSVDLWDFVVAIPLGVLGALLAGLLGFTMATVRKGAMRFRSRPVVLATLGGLALGVIAFALPLTRFAGAAELTTLLDHAPELGAALVIVLILAKILAVALSFGTGFYGGPIFPMIFIGGAAGVAVHLLIPDIPEGLAVVALFAAVPGAGASIPFTLTFLAAMTLTLASPAEAAPAAIATAVSYTLFTGFLAPKPHPTRPAEGPTPADG